MLGITLSGCMTNHESRYRDNTALERPPTVKITKEDAEIAAANELEPVKRHHGKGLKSDVYKVEGSETRLRIKRSNEESWPLIRQAIQLHELKIADEDRSKGVFYVVYDGGGLFNQAASLFTSDEKKQTYFLKMEESLDGETELTVSMANNEEQADPAGSKDGVDSSSQDGSGDLSDLLFDALYNEVKED